MTRIVFLLSVSHKHNIALIDYKCCLQQLRNFQSDYLLSSLSVSFTKAHVSVTDCCQNYIYAKWKCIGLRMLHVKQIKICVNTGTWYPRPKPVWQEPRMCLTNRLGLATVSRYSTQILICFTAYIFPFSIPLVCWVGNLVFRDCLTMTTVHFDENRAVSKENQIFQHPLHQLVKCCKTINPLVCIELMKLADKVDKIYISGMFFCPRTKLISLFYIGKWPLTKYIHSMLPM